MRKFTNFLVLLISVVLLIVVCAAMLQRCVPAKNSKPGEAMILPQSDLPQLVISSSEAFNAQLDLLCKKGGLKEIGGYVEKEFVPGRALTLASTHKSEASRRFIILDRELRRCDAEGVVNLADPPVVARTAATLKISARSSIQSWSRLRLDTPFVLTLWCLEKEK